MNKKVTFPSVCNWSCSIAFELWSRWTWRFLTEQRFCLGVELRWRQATKCSDTLAVQTVIRFLDLMPTVDEGFSCVQGLCDDGFILRGELGKCSLAWAEGGHEGTRGAGALSSLLAGFICFLTSTPMGCFCFHSRQEHVHSLLQKYGETLVHTLIYFSFRICYPS